MSSPGGKHQGSGVYCFGQILPGYLPMITPDDFAAAQNKCFAALLNNADDNPNGEYHDYQA